MNLCAICAQPLLEQAAARNDASVHADCWLAMEDKVRELLKSDDTIFQPYKAGDDIHLSRTPNGTKQTNVPRVYYLHSSSGFEWGFKGSGPSELALNILLLFTNVRTAQKLHQEFKNEFIATLPVSGGTINEAVIRSWLLMSATSEETDNLPR